MEEVLTEVVQLAAKEKKKKKKDKKAEQKDTEQTEESTAEEQAFLPQVNWQNPSWDLFLVMFFVVGAVLYGVSLGKERVNAVFISIYIALAIVQALPEKVFELELTNNFTFHITGFIALFVMVFFLLSRGALLSSLIPGVRGKLWQVIVFSVLHVGLLISVGLSFFPEDLLNNFSETIQFLFTNEWLRFVWIIAPIVAMVALGKGRGDD